MEELATTGILHRFVPNVKFSRLQRSLKKIHSEELDSEIATHHFGRSVQFSEGKCSASDLDTGLNLSITLKIFTVRNSALGYFVSQF